MSEDLGVFFPGIDNIVIEEKEIGLTISQNGSETFYFYTHKDVDIINVDVKVITSAFTDNYATTPITWSEENNYLFSIGEVKKHKGLTNSGEYQHSVLVKMLDSPIVSCREKENSDVYLRFYIYYNFEGVDRRIIADTTKPEIPYQGEHIKYYSKTYRNRALLPYSIQLDSIYRPFFCNSALFFFDGNSVNNEEIITQDSYKNISGDTYCKFYFSIANGCTMRDKKYPIYRIGDINLKITNIGKGGAEDKEGVYNFTIKDNFRIFSEIEDFNDPLKGKTRNDSLKKAHIRGIKESGVNDTLNDFTCSDGQYINGGIFLPQVDKNDYFKVEHYYNDDTGLTPSNITYIKNNEGVDVYNIYTAQKFNTTQPLNIELIVNDTSPDGINFKTNKIECEYVIFPEKIEFGPNYNILKIYNYGYCSDITYISCNDKDLEKIYELLGKMNVNDNISEDEVNDDIFNYLHSLKNQQIEFIMCTPNGKICTAVSQIIKPEYILAIYHGGYKKDEDLLRYIKHTNKLLIMRLYKL